ncbi:hypothetical protein OSTOST_00121 [Ostertagia ostertagi]
MDAVSAEMPGVCLKGYFFHYTQCILRHRDELHLRSAASKNAVIRVFFRRIQMLPLLPPQYIRLSEALRAPAPPLVTPVEHNAILAFLRYWHDTWGAFGRFGNNLWDHSSTSVPEPLTTRKGSTLKFEQRFPGTRSRTLVQRFARTQLTTAKSVVVSARDMGASPYVRPQEQQRQREIATEMHRLREEHINRNVMPTTRQCKDYLDFMAQRLAH